MGTDEDNTTEEAIEKGEQVFDFWSDEGARIFNEALDEGSAYMLAHHCPRAEFEDCLDDEQCEYLDPDLGDADEETLPPGEMELILENCFIM
jgi:hypothetical protein